MSKTGGAPSKSNDKKEQQTGTGSGPWSWEVTRMSMIGVTLLLPQHKTSIRLPSSESQSSFSFRLQSWQRTTNTVQPPTIYLFTGNTNTTRKPPDRTAFWTKRGSDTTIPTTLFRDWCHESIIASVIGTELAIDYQDAVDKLLSANTNLGALLPALRSGTAAGAEATCSLISKVKNATQHQA